MSQTATQGFTSFAEFYPYYLSEHSNLTCRRLHYIGTSLGLSFVVAAFITGRYGLLWMMPLSGYTFAWVGHFFFEHNKPATFKYPFYSLAGDFVMLKDMLTGKIRF